MWRENKQIAIVGWVWEEMDWGGSRVGGHVVILLIIFLPRYYFHGTNQPLPLTFLYIAVWHL